MDNRISDDIFFERLSEASEPSSPSPAKAPSRLKSRVYSSLASLQSESGPLLSVSESEAGGRLLCVFEKLVQIAPVGEKAKSLNFCRVCHARVAAEILEDAPIYWSHCPYVGFQNR